MIIYTIGHSTRKIEEFLSILEKYHIKLVVDVRRFPGSKKFPQFNKEELSKTLRENRIRYVWMGDLLGGYRRGGYRKYMETNEFKRGIRELIKKSIDKKTAIMCAEIVWFRCHRRFISDELVKRGHKVIHIIDGGKTYEHKLRLSNKA